MVDSRNLAGLRVGGESAGKQHGGEERKPGSKRKEKEIGKERRRGTNSGERVKEEGEKVRVKKRYVGGMAQQGAGSGGSEAWSIYEDERDQWPLNMCDRVDREGHDRCEEKDGMEGNSGRPEGGGSR